MDVFSKIGIGTVQFGTKYGISNTSGQTDNEEVRRILLHANKVGIKYIDTASAYGNSEKVLGLNDLSEFKIISKFMPPTDEFPIEWQLHHSLSELNISKLYGYLAHRPLELIKDPKTWLKLESLKSSGEIEKIGFSLNQPSELEELLKLDMKPDIVQVPFNYFDNRFRNQLILLKNIGCEIHTRSTFLQGLFFSRIESLSDFFLPVKDTIIELQNRYQKKLPGFLLNYVLNLDFVDVVVIGVENLAQLEMNLKQMKTSEIAEEFRDIAIDEKILMPSMWPKNN